MGFSVPLLAALTTSPHRLPSLDAVRIVASVPLDPPATANKGLSSRLPLVGSKWRLLMNVGRTDSSKTRVFGSGQQVGVQPRSMPDDWALSGAALPLGLDVQFGENTMEQAAHEEILHPSRSSGAVNMELNTLESVASFIGMHGQQEVDVKGGEAHLALVDYGKRSGTHSLRFWLDLEGGVTHHDIELKPDERLFFFSNCWDRELLDDSTAQLQQIDEQIEALEARSTEVERAATTDAWLRMRSFHDQQDIREYRFIAELERKRRRSELPPTELQNPVPGPCGTAVARRGLICVKRQWQTAPFGFLKLELPIPRTMYEMVGTFELRPL